MYKGSKYSLMELMEANGINANQPKRTYDAIAIFKNNENDGQTDFEYVNYFYGADEPIEKLIATAQTFIDMATSGASKNEGKKSFSLGEISNNLFMFQLISHNKASIMRQTAKNLFTVAQEEKRGLTANEYMQFRKYQHNEFVLNEINEMLGKIRLLIDEVNE